MLDARTTVIRTIKAYRSDGSVVDIIEYRVSGTDPTFTGSVWKAPMSYIGHKLPSGEAVECYDDGTAFVVDSGETLIIVKGK